MLKERILATLLFFDLQNFPLTLLELQKYLLNDLADLRQKIDQNFEINQTQLTPPKRISVDVILQCLSEEGGGEIETKHGFYCLLGRTEIINSRLANYEYGIFRERRIRKFLSFLRFLPFVRGVAVGGSQSLGQQKATSDIDLFILTDQQFLWAARIFVTAYFQIIGVRRHGKKIQNRFCLNHYLTKQTVSGQGKDLYNAMEYLRLRPVIGEYSITNFQKANLGWLLGFFPNFEHQIWPEEPQAGLQKYLEKMFTNSWGKRFEYWLGAWQLKRIQRGEYVVASNEELSFHSVARKKSFLANFFQILAVPTTGSGGGDS